MVQEKEEEMVYWNDTKAVGFSESEDLHLFSRKKDFVSAYGVMEYDESNQRQNEEEVFDVSTDSRRSPLGLSLKKTPSFAELIEAKLLQAKNNNDDSSVVARKRKRDEDQKMKATSWDAKLLRIGTWERRAHRDQGLVAKCYYQKRKLVWEMLDGALKNKIEVQWSDITAIRASFPHNKNAVLEIEVKNIPLFCRESPPQPRKHTSWHPTSDFTGGEAPRYRRHYLQFEEGTLQPHYEKLLRCDKRLFMLSRQPFPMNRSPYFNINMSGEYSFESSRLQPEFPPMLQFSQYGNQAPSYVPLHPTQTYLSENNFQLPQSPYQLMPAMVQPLSFQYPLQSSGNVLPQPPSSSSLLNDLANNLLHAPMAPVCTDEQKLMARIRSMCNLLELNHEQTQVQNADISDGEYSYSTNNSISSSSGESSENWATVTAQNQNMLANNHQRIPSFSNLYFDQGFDQFGMPNSGMNNMR